jgi:6,7-dimethyl-8-ribityllumazine synthase
MQRENRRKKQIVSGVKFKIAIIVSEFNSGITKKMLKGALAVLEKNKVKNENIKIVWVPGSFELPLVCQKLAKEKKYDGIVALGCVIRGETDHYYYISSETARGIMSVMLEYSIPIGFGVITANNVKQARERSGTGSNKGIEAAEAVLEMINILGQNSL